jgi:spore coat polysaccharide biosynthesis protein SpsF
VTPRVVASVEARMGSSRFPGKVLADVAGRPALDRLVTRLRRAEAVDDIILATSTAPADDALAAWAAAAGLACHRGSEDDVLERVVEAHRAMSTDVIVEITGDCPLVDPELVDMAVRTFTANDCDVVTNAATGTYPNGMDVQVFRRVDLEEVERSVDDPAVREHVSLHFYEQPERYRLIHLVAPPRWTAPDVRLVLDYEEDLELIDAVYRRLEPAHGDGFGLEEVLALLRREPELAAVNRHCVDKPVRP